jgi:predicted site-specific integrase-resolvase
VVVEHQERATSLGFRFLETLLEQQRRRIEVVHPADKRGEKVVAALVAIFSSLCARHSGQRRAKRKTETSVKAVNS